MTFTFTNLVEGTKIRASVLNDNFSGIGDQVTALFAQAKSELDADIRTINGTVSDLSTDVDNCVKTSGNQTAAGNKTWTGTNTFKGDTYVPNSATVGTAVSTAAIVKATNGYIKFGNGIILQWGIFTATNRTTTQITLPTPFKKAKYSIVYTQYGTAVTDSDWINSILTVSKNESYFEYRSNVNERPKYQWIAIGY